jgi:DNA polymerase (family 10)
MPVHNADIAAVFDEVADLLEIQQASVFRVRAYRNAARVIRDQTSEVTAMLERGEDLTKLPGIGKDLAAQIEEIVTSGISRKLEELQKELPAGLVELLKIPGLGPKKVKLLFDELNITSTEQLSEAAEKGKLHPLPGFGEKTERAIVKALKTREGFGKRLMLAVAAQYAEPLAAFLSKIKGVKQVVIAGSYRRGKETVGDVDILVTAREGTPVMDRFVNYDEVAQVLAEGTTKSTVLLKSGLQVDLRLVPQECFGAALQYFTGSQAHNVAVRDLGVKSYLKINEYGVFRGAERIAGDTEESVYETLGLPWIPPELREARGEIEAARSGRLPRLIELSDIRGDLHSHTKATDGKNTLAEMARAARDFGLEYLAITEHSRRLTVARGLTPERLREHMREIDKLNEELDGIVLLKSIEVDILQDGSLDLPDDVLEELDLVVASVHSYFNLPRKEQTARVLKAMSHPCVTIIGHPSGRLIQEREAYDVDLEKVIEHAAETGCVLEVNSHPERLDLTDVYCRMAKENGVLVSIDSDAHNIYDFNNLRYGVGQARRGWLEAKDVLNTRPLTEMKKLLSSLKKQPAASARRSSGRRRH